MRGNTRQSMNIKEVDHNASIYSMTEVTLDDELNLSEDPASRRNAHSKIENEESIVFPNRPLVRRKANGGGHDTSLQNSVKLDCGHAKFDASEKLNLKNTGDFSKSKQDF